MIAFDVLSRTRHRGNNVIRARIVKMASQQSYYVGIDIGQQTLSFSFLSAGRQRVLTYSGSVEEMLCYELGQNITRVVNPLTSKDATSGDKLLSMIDALPEFSPPNRILGFIVERQMGSQTFAQRDGIIFGYLRGKGIPGLIMDSRLRVSFTQWSMDKAGILCLTVEEVKVLSRDADLRRLAEDTSDDDVVADKRRTGRKVPLTKLAPMSFVRYRYPDYFTQVVDQTTKVDDICDALCYAYMCSQGLYNTKAISAMKKAKRSRRTKQASSDDDA